MDKSELRGRIRDQRRNRRPGTSYVERVLARVPPESTVCCYVSLPGEPPTEGLIEALLRHGCTVLLPVAGPGGLLSWTDAASSRPWQAWGVPGHPVAPDTIVELPTVDTVIVPALAVDGDGRRLGQGGGYYDRFLPTVPDARTIALLWTGEVLAELPAEPHDRKVDEWVMADG